MRGADQSDNRKRNGARAEKPRPPDRRAHDAKREKRQRIGRERPQVERRAGRFRDEARRPENELDARPDIEPDRTVEPERIERGAEERPGTAKNSMMVRVSGLPIST